MRIGIFGGYDAYDPTTGGGFTFEQSLLETLPNVDSNHEFFVFSYGRCEEKTVKNVTYRA